MMPPEAKREMRLKLREAVIKFSDWLRENADIISNTMTDTIDLAANYIPEEFVERMIRARIRDIDNMLGDEYTLATMMPILVFTHVAAEKHTMVGGLSPLTKHKIRTMIQTNMVAFSSFLTSIIASTTKTLSSMDRHDEEAIDSVIESMLDIANVAAAYASWILFSPNARANLLFTALGIDR